MITSQSPLIPEVGVLGLPYHQWGSRWMTPHHVLTRLAHYFRILWLEPAHHWRACGKVSARRREVASTVGTFPPGFEVHVPEWWLPKVHRLKRTREMLARARYRRAWARLDARGCAARVLYLWHPGFESALSAGRHDVSVYHIDDEYSFRPDSPRTTEQEARVIAAVDSVMAISPRLMERKGGINPNTIFMPEGADYRLYSTPVPEPQDLGGIPRPRIGYTGVLKKQLDWPLLRELAQRHPDWSFVLVGPAYVTGDDLRILEQMSVLGNVHRLGPKDVMDLARYPQHFDACIMPYRVNEYTNNIYPLKLHEYLASGRPVVGTPIRSLQDFEHVIELAEDPDGWCRALAACLGERAVSAAEIGRRQAIAREHDWSELVYRIAREICTRLGPDQLARLRKLDLGKRPPDPAAPVG